MSAPPPANVRPLTPWAVAAALGLALLWGGNAVAIKVSVGGLPSISLLTARTALGLVFLLGWAAVAGVSLRLRRGELLPLCGLSLLFSLQVLALIHGTSLTLSVRSIVLMNTFPFFTAVFAHLLLPGDRLNWRTITGSLLGLAGVSLAAVAAAPPSEGATALTDTFLLGDAMVLASAAGLGLRQVISKRLMSTVPPERLLVWMMTLSIPLTSSLAWGLERHLWQPLSGAHWLATLYTGVVISGFGFAAYQTLLRRYRASTLATPALSTPLCGILLGWAILGERLPAVLAAGAALIAVGIYLVNSRRKGKRNLVAALTATETGSSSVPGSPRRRSLLRSLLHRGTHRSAGRHHDTPRSAFRSPDLDE